MRRYLIGWLVVVLALIAAVVVINLVVDPYAVYGKIRVAGFNDIKPRAQQQGTLGKRASIARLRPRALVLGNSRAEIGFDPASPAWPAAAGPVYNAALPGTGLHSSIDVLRHAIGVQKPVLAVVGLEFNDFLLDPTVSSTSNRPVPALPTARHVSRDLRLCAREVATTLLSLDALMDSLSTIKARSDPHATTLRRDGFNPMHDYEAIARREGYYAMFRQRDIENLRSYAHAPRNIFAGASRTSPDFEALKNLLTLARVQGIELKLVIYPYHAHLLETFQVTGLWPVFEQWKRAVVETVRQEGIDANAKPHVLWDFSGYHDYATERVPDLADRDQTVQWYWEAGHFKKELGNVMLGRIFGTVEDSNTVMFGVAIDADNIETHLARLRAQAQRFVESNRALRTELAGYVSTFRRP